MEMSEPLLSCLCGNGGLTFNGRLLLVDFCVLPHCFNPCSPCRSTGWASSTNHCPPQNLPKYSLHCLFFAAMVPPDSWEAYFGFVALPETHTEVLGGASFMHCRTPLSPNRCGVSLMRDFFWLFVVSHAADMYMMFFLFGWQVFDICSEYLFCSNLCLYHKIFSLLFLLKLAGCGVHCFCGHWPLKTLVVYYCVLCCYPMGDMHCFTGSHPAKRKRRGTLCLFSFVYLNKSNSDTFIYFKTNISKDQSICASYL